MCVYVHFHNPESNAVLNITSAGKRIYTYNYEWNNIYIEIHSNARTQTHNRNIGNVSQVLWETHIWFLVGTRYRSTATNSSSSNNNKSICSREKESGSVCSRLSDIVLMLPVSFAKCLENTVIRFIQWCCNGCVSDWVSECKQNVLFNSPCMRFGAVHVDYQEQTVLLFIARCSLLETNQQ